MHRMVLIFPLKSIHIQVCIIIVILLSKKLLYQLYHITLQYNQYPKLYLFIFLPLHLNILFIIYLVFLSSFLLSLSLSSSYKQPPPPTTKISTQQPLLSNLPPTVVAPHKTTTETTHHWILATNPNPTTTETHHQSQPSNHQS